MRAAISRLSRPVINGAALGFCETSPMLCRTAAGSRRTSWPATRTAPESGRDKVERMRTVVDFPAPLGPRRPKISPGRTWSVSPSRARTGGFERPTG